MNLAKVEQAEKLLGVGRFEVASLVQKRIHELVRGAPPLVKIRSDNPIEIALEEILQGRITLVREVEEPGLGEGGLTLDGAGADDVDPLEGI